MFTQEDKNFLDQRGISPEYLDWQLQSFKQGFAPLDLVSPATPEKGIVQSIDKSYFTDLYEKSHSDVIKFVPASGAASRMFKELFSFLEAENAKPLSGNMLTFFEQINHFAFYKSLDKEMLSKKGLTVSQAIEQKQYKLIVDTLLNDMEYGTLPKALLEFHAYDEKVRTPIEEHFVEGASYAKTGDSVKIHFTVSPEHRERFELLVNEKRASYETVLGVKLHISYSEQKKSTDTLAVDLENNPFRNSDGSLLLRPAGHGALLENLNELDAELVFIKNIDNVVPERLLSDTITHKKLLAGVLIEAKNKIFTFIEHLSDRKPGTIQEIEEYYQTVLCEAFGDFYASLSLEEKVKFLAAKLNRPIKVCGMVKNEGEPGGGPFWVRDKNGGISLQIVESAQIDLSNPAQKAIMESSTHFNPVDLVCWIKDSKGQKFDLSKYRDNNAGFISQKSKDGKELKALELPGLWNGAMADWNTIFVEVPLSTFNPVKTVFDLLRKEHANISI